MKRPGGYSLIEFIVTMAILAILLPALTLAFRTTIDASERVDRRSVMTAEARAILPVLTQDLQNAFVPNQTGTSWLIGTDSATGSSPADSLSLTTLSGRAPVTVLAQDGTPADSEEPLSPLVQVNYSLEPGVEEGRNILLRSFSSPPGEDPTAVTDNEVLSDSVIGFDLQYFDGTDWTDSWDTTQTEEAAAGGNATDEAQPPLLPRSIRVSVTLFSEDGPQTYTTVVSLPMVNASASRIEQEPQGNTTGGANAAPPEGGADTTGVGGPGR